MEIEFSQESSRLAARYDFIVYPLDFMVLKKVLGMHDYKMAQPPGDAPPDAILTVDGQIGKRDEFAVDVSTERQIFGLNSSSYHKLESEFNKLEDSLSKEIGVELTSKTRFYEFIYHAMIRTGSNPLEVLARVGKTIPICDEMSKILGKRVAPLVVRLSPALTPVESENWFDFTLEPIMNKATVAYHVGFVFRDAEKSRVLEKINNFNVIIEDSLKLIENRS